MYFTCMIEFKFNFVFSQAIYGDFSCSRKAVEITWSRCSPYLTVQSIFTLWNMNNEMCMLSKKSYGWRGEMKTKAHKRGVEFRFPHLLVSVLQSSCAPSCPYLACFSLHYRVLDRMSWIHMDKKPQKKWDWRCTFSLNTSRWLALVVTFSTGWLLKIQFRSASFSSQYLYK